MQNDVLDKYEDDCSLHSPHMSYLRKYHSSPPINYPATTHETLYWGLYTISTEKDVSDNTKDNLMPF